MDNYYDDERGVWVTAESRYSAVATQERLDAIWAALSTDGARAWTLILRLLADLPEDTVNFLGAGPLEEFVRLRAAEFIEQIEREHARNPRFRTALFEIWLERGELAPEVEQRLLHLLGPGFEFLDDGSE